MLESIIDTIKEKFSFENKTNKYMDGRKNIGQSIFEYTYLMRLDEKEYPNHLKKAYLFKTDKKLNLRNPKTINEKIQWLKLYDNLPIKAQLTDKVLVRDWVKEKIGEQYLKPVLQICNTFEEIDFDNLPDKFIIKCNHGCKWHIVVKNKQGYLDNKIIYKLTKVQMENWLIQSFFGWSDFEIQYKNIIPKIIIEPLLIEEGRKEPEAIEIYCFNSEPKLFRKVNHSLNDKHEVSAYDENYKPIDFKIKEYEEVVNEEVDDNLKKAVELSKELCKDFKFVRVDWMTYNGQLYFEEMTFTPYSGFYNFTDKYKDWNIKLGNMLNLKGNKNGR